MLAGVTSTFKGTIVGQEMTKWPDQLDFSVELSKARGVKPDAIFAFYPGASGAQFLIQYLQSGLKDQIPLYTAFTIDEITLPRQKDAAARYSRCSGMGQRACPTSRTSGSSQITEKKHPGLSPTFYGAQTYDATSHRLGRGRDERQLFRQGSGSQGYGKGRLQVPRRGKFRFGNNHIPIQNFYLQEAVKDGDRYALKTVATIVEDSQDRFHNDCPMSRGSRANLVLPSDLHTF